jgi:hypothetical protein
MSAPAPKTDRTGRTEVEGPAHRQAAEARRIRRANRRRLRRMRFVSA